MMGGVPQCRARGADGKEPEAAHCEYAYTNPASRPGRCASACAQRCRLRAAAAQDVQGNKICPCFLCVNFESNVKHGDELFIPTLPLNIVIPDTFNDDMHVVALYNVVNPDTFNDDKNVDAPETNKLVKLVLFNSINNPAVFVFQRLPPP